jgi:hypothetical protein
LPPVTVKDKNAYKTHVNKMFVAGIFLNVFILRGRKVIKGC